MAAAVLAVPILASGLALASDDFEEAPVRYSTTPARDAVALLQQRIDSGQVTLQREGDGGYLAPVLRALKVPASSQMLVFSKTSFQRDRISPATPRALYFDDRTYVGWVQGGEYLELASQDPQLGTVFYVLDQYAAKPKFIRQTDECLSCHGSTLTHGVPGLVMRSVLPDGSGQPILQAGTHVTTDQSPLKERWGGWYVTGTHGSQRHMGNLTAKDATESDRLNLDRGANITDLRKLVDPAPYLTRHSDIVALMVSEHQVGVLNLITRAGQETRRALEYEQALNRDLHRPADYRSDSTVSRVRSVCEPLVQGLLFCGEAPLTAPVQGTSGFAAEFAKRGPQDSQGRSLRQLDLKRRLFRYPCSYLIYSEAFDALPPLAKEYVYRRLHEVLEAADPGSDFSHLTVEDRKAIREILMDTKPEFASWKQGA